jgi:tellurite resistance protein TehA-like permease
MACIFIISRKFALGIVINKSPTVPNPYRFVGLETVGEVIMLLNVLLYITTWLLLITRFYLYPPLLKASFLHPTESLFVPSAMVSLGTILINISQYGLDKTGQWLADVMFILFWVDVILAIVSSVGIYLLL